MVIRIVCIGGAVGVLVVVQGLVWGSRGHPSVEVHGLMRRLDRTSTTCPTLESELADWVLLVMMVLCGRGCD